MQKAVAAHSSSPALDDEERDRALAHAASDTEATPGAGSRERVLRSPRLRGGSVRTPFRTRATAIADDESQSETDSSADEGVRQRNMLIARARLLETSYSLMNNLLTRVDAHEQRCAEHEAAEEEEARRVHALFLQTEGRRARAATLEKPDALRPAIVVGEALPRPPRRDMPPPREPTSAFDLMGYAVDATVALATSKAVKRRHRRASMPVEVSEKQLAMLAQSAFTCMVDEPNERLRHYAARRSEEYRTRRYTSSLEFSAAYHEWIVIAEWLRKVSFEMWVRDTYCSEIWLPFQRTLETLPLHTGKALANETRARSRAYGVRHLHKISFSSRMDDDSTLYFILYTHLERFVREARWRVIKDERYANCFYCLANK